ncbi:MAG TPA: hypothetical protein DF715_11420, partial [Oceanicaulis sp.]|nr:hypothetical protein [Oceanicaulis sp.]
MSVAARLYDQHRETLDTALKAVRIRDHWSPFRESPSAKLHGEEAPRLGKSRFEAQLGKPFDLEQPGTIGTVGAEVSPYTREPLGITYPKSDPAALFAASRKAMSGWTKASVEERAGIITEMLFAMERNAFENAHATMHTAGQGL